MIQKINIIGMTGNTKCRVTNEELYYGLIIFSDLGMCLPGYINITLNTIL